MDRVVATEMETCGQILNSVEKARRIVDDLDMGLG